MIRLTNTSYESPSFFESIVYISNGTITMILSQRVSIQWIQYSSVSWKCNSSTHGSMSAASCGINFTTVLKPRTLHKLYNISNNCDTSFGTLYSVFWQACLVYIYMNCMMGWIKSASMVSRTVLDSWYFWRIIVTLFLILKASWSVLILDTKP